MTSAGLKDCLARVPIDMAYGQVVTCRHISTDNDSIPCPETRFRSVRINFPDGLGRTLSMEYYCVLELNFTEVLSRM